MFKFSAVSQIWKKYIQKLNDWDLPLNAHRNAKRNFYEYDIPLQKRWNSKKKLIFIFGIAPSKPRKPLDCKDLHESGQDNDGVYTIYPSNKPLQVYCDMTTDSGGWTVSIDGSTGGYSTNTCHLLLQRLIYPFPYKQTGIGVLWYDDGLGRMDGKYWWI